MSLELRDLRPGEMPAAAGVLAAGMRDNPVNVAAFGPDPLRRQRCLTRMFTVLFRVISAQRRLGAWRDEHENVVFYERHGCVLVDRADVLGRASWSMARPAGDTGGQAGRRTCAVPR